MTIDKDELLKLAKECGAEVCYRKDAYALLQKGDVVVTTDELLAFANAIEQKSAETARAEILVGMRHMKDQSR